MNKVRRTAIAKIKEQIEDLKWKLDELLEEEQEAYDNMPDNLQCSERGEKAEECIDALEEAISNIEDACDNLDTAIEQEELKMNKKFRNFICNAILIIGFTVFFVGMFMYMLVQYTN